MYGNGRQQMYCGRKEINEKCSKVANIKGLEKSVLSKKILFTCTSHIGAQ